MNGTLGHRFYIQVYDQHDIIVGHTSCKTEDEAHRAFIALCCSKDRVSHTVKLFLNGDLEPLVWAFRNGRSMENLITDVSVRNVIN